MLKDYQATTTGGQNFGNAASDEQHIEEVSKQLTNSVLRGTEVAEIFAGEDGTVFALVVLIFAAGFFTVGSQERAVVLRFGKPIGEGQKMLLTAGLHWSLPYPIDEVVRIPVTELQHVTSTAGWYYTTPEMELTGFEPPPGPSPAKKRSTASATSPPAAAR